MPPLNQPRSGIFLFQLKGLRPPRGPNGLFCLQVRGENDLPASLLTLAASLPLCLEDGLGNLVPVRKPLAVLHFLRAEPPHHPFLVGEAAGRPRAIGLFGGAVFEGLFVAIEPLVEVVRELDASRVGPALCP